MYNKYSNNSGGVFIYVIFFGIFALLGLGSCSLPFLTKEEVTFTVTDKERITESNGESVSSKYLVFTENETFENSDILLLGKFNSSDLYGKLKKGTTYNASVYGFRVPFMSMYRNIIEVKEVH